MGLISTVYNSVLKRTSTYVFTVAAGAFIFERSFDMGTELFFEKMNEGKLWKHIKHNYETQE